MIIYRQRNFSLVSRGVRFIKELRTIDPLPITVEEFEKILYGWIKKKPGKKMSFMLVDDPEVDKIEDKLNQYYKNDKAAEVVERTGRAYCESCFNDKIEVFHSIDNKDKKYWDSLRFAYSKVNKLPKRYITQSLGLGYCGIVFDYSGNKIEKIDFLKFAPNELKFYKYLKSNPISVFPRIYDVEEDQVIMEKLKTDTPKVKKCYEYIKKYINKNDASDGYRDRDPNWKLMEEELGKNHWFYKFIQDIEIGLNKIFGRKTIGDIRHENIGERNDGTLVFFDPIGGRLAMK